MLTAQKLEKIMELEDNLRTEYQAKLEEKSAEVERYRQQLAEQREELQATIDRQLETITELSGKASVNQRSEQLNRELTNRSEKLQEEASGLKKRVKSLQKELAEAKAELKSLKQFDPPRMKKNLDSNKKKLAEKTRANDLLQKSLNKAKAENAQLQRKVEELEARLPQQEAGEGAEEEEAA
jgi:chromosome segregation ATPase